MPGHRGLTSVPQRLESTLQVQLAQEDASELDTDDLKNEHRGTAEEFARLAARPA